MKKNASPRRAREKKVDMDGQDTCRTLLTQLEELQPRAYQFRLKEDPHTWDYIAYHIITAGTPAVGGKSVSIPDYRKVVVGRVGRGINPLTGQQEAFSVRRIIPVKTEVIWSEFDESR